MGVATVGGPAWSLDPCGHSQVCFDQVWEGKSGGGFLGIDSTTSRGCAHVALELGVRVFTGTYESQELSFSGTVGNGDGLGSVGSCRRAEKIVQ